LTGARAAQIVGRVVFDPKLECVKLVGTAQLTRRLRTVVLGTYPAERNLITAFGKLYQFAA
jgi:hypothetical protein